ncbi:hypothetical protein EBR43_12135 [bacterium]|nr:hypothetical protein [bacterium]
MFSGGNPLSSLFGSLLSGRQNNNFEVIEEEDSQELESDIQKLREEIGDLLHASMSLAWQLLPVKFFFCRSCYS